MLEEQGRDAAKAIQAVAPRGGGVLGRSGIRHPVIRRPSFGAPRRCCKRPLGPDTEATGRPAANRILMNLSQPNSHDREDRMSNPIAVILRFKGDPDDLLGRFEQALRSLSEARYDGTRPAFFAICKSEEGIALISGWGAEEDHKAFRKQIMSHLQAAGVSRPDVHEQLGIAQLGWEPARPDAP